MFNECALVEVLHMCVEQVEQDQEDTKNNGGVVPRNKGLANINY